MRIEATTIKDIAHALGLSKSTVSRALRDSYEISDMTKQLVLGYAKTINYTPNPIAVSLKARKSKSIGVVVPEIADSFFSQVINGIESVANEKGYTVMITQSLETEEGEINNISFLALRSVDGCLASVSEETNDFSHFCDLHKKGLPIVFFDRIVECVQSHAVTVENVQAAYEGTAHLLKNNYRKIAFIANAPNLYITTKRFEGYLKALREYGVPYDENMINYCPHGGRYYEEVESVLKSLLSKQHRPDAIFLSTDKLTTSFLRCCKNLGLKIPEDFALVGFSNLDITDLMQPSLTVLRQPAFEMGRRAAMLLIKAIETKRTDIDCENECLPAQLIIGDSSKARCLAS
ncbi:LacI family DNA-binding transcriptional regulator [Danxiaibacter flavus]|uniref:LacI family DNA-binding transcriptional regulator n=1 Tax=Danxiaibacter flavus TaxID=3049108 RepID=A0ABV3ZK88_9BACT|nr:LacI family DNA-binding transcriptional regulator [Chitinophagaceae bacterium DXS]